MILLKNCNLIYIDKERIDLKDILIENNLIKNIGYNLKEDEAEIIDLNGAYVTPGFIDCATEIGLIESGKKCEGNDCNETYVDIIPGMKVINGIYPYDPYFSEAINSGVTTVIVNSGSHNVIGAQSAVLKTYSKILNEMEVSSSIDIKGNLGDSPKQWNYNSRKSPLSRMGIMDIIRKALINTKKYMDHKEYCEDSFNYDALSKVLKREIPLKITANKAQDILSAIELKKEFHIEVVIDQCAEGYMVKEYLKEAEIPVIISSPLIDTSSLELMGSRLDNARMLIDAGVEVALATHHPQVCCNLLLFSAAMLEREGLSIYEALKLITSNPAKIFNLHHNIGIIEKGKEADILAFDNLPTKAMANIVLKMVGGKIV